MKQPHSSQPEILADSVPPSQRFNFVGFFLKLLVSAADRLPHWAPVPLRVIVGCGFMMHGYVKLSRGPHLFACNLQGLGYPVPEFLAWATIATEVLGGCFILLGAFVGLASVPLAVTMTVAIVTVHFRYGFSSIKLISANATGITFGKPVYEMNLLYLGCLWALTAGGPGPLAFENVLKRWWRTANQQRSRELITSPHQDSL